jgi:protein-disulfide isomerase
VKLTRRDTLTLAAAATAAGLAGFPTLALAKDGDVIDPLTLMAPAGIPDRVDGNPDAKVTLIEYASPTCPHCALFSNTTLQPFKDKYVATGKVKYILRPFARNTMDAAIFMLAEAAANAAGGIPSPSAAASSEPSSESSSEAPSSAEAAPAPSPAAAKAGVDAYENVIATFFKTQETWGISDKPLDAVKAVAFQLGFDEDSFTTALKNQDYFNAIEKMRDQAMNEFELEGTPSFYLNGKLMSGEKTLDQLSAEIDPLLQ